MNSYLTAELVKFRQAEPLAEAPRARPARDSRRARIGRCRNGRPYRSIPWAPAPRRARTTSRLEPWRPVITAHRLEQDT